MIFDQNMDLFPVFCDFESEPNSTWTQVMSFNLKEIGLSSFPFFTNSTTDALISKKVLQR